MGKDRFLWEQIMEEPDLYRVWSAGSRQNSYVIASEGQALVIDPRSGQMLRNIRRLARALDVGEGMIRTFLTRIDEGQMVGFLREQIPGSDVYTMLLPDSVQEKTESSGEWDSWKEVVDGDVIRVGACSLQCIAAEGCQRGQMALWFPEKGILFSGDAIGCDHVPDVMNWDEKIDVMGLQIEVLRRFRSLPVRCILPGTGAAAGVEETDWSRSERFSGNADDASAKKRNRPGISAASAEVVDGMLSRYCIRILETYQKIPSGGSIEEEKILRPDDGRRAASDDAEDDLFSPGGGKGYAAQDSAVSLAAKYDLSRTEGRSLESCLKYLLYRKYIRKKETKPGQYVYERGSQSLSDWGTF